MPDGVGQDDEILLGVERLALAEQLACEGGVSIEAPEPAVPCSTTTGSPVGSPIVR